ncbi:MAG: PQQ-binding-like beta-propeller repeat protein [Planctomycetes bacterium]|nr:PQQ-binding-like beta-propeller repeat protein [Planctomycetota bacterium]
MPRTTLLTATILLMACAAGADDWPQFHGPRGDGKSREKGLLHKFPPTGPKVLWRVKVGIGYGGPAIQDGRVYLLDRVSSRSEALRCFDLPSGKELWHYSYPAAGNVSHPGSRSTPAVDDKFVITIGRLGDVYCFSKAAHRPVWRKHLLRDYGGGRRPTWAVAQSPVLYKDDIVILAPQGSRAGVVALRRATGEELWRSPPIGPMDYVTPRLATIDGTDQVLMVNRLGVTSVDASNGKLLWRYGGWTCRIPIPAPTPLPDGRVFITGGYDAGSAMIKVSKGPAGWTVRQLWKTDECNSQMNPGMLLGGYIYANSNSNSDSDGMVCLDLDGKLLWRTGRRYNFQRGHMMYADGMILAIDGRAGSLYLLAASPKGIEELDKAAGLLGGREIWAPLALSDGKLVIRDQSKMLCLDIKAR